MLSLLFETPSTTEVFTEAGTWSVAIFNELSPFAYLVVGIFVGAILLGWFADSVIEAFQNFAERRRAKKQQALWIIQ